MKKLGLASLLLLLGVVIPSGYRAGAENPWDLLKDFRHVQGTLRPIEDHYVAALFYQRQKDLRALVIFSTNCHAQHCWLGEPVAYSVFNAKGLVIGSHEDSGQDFLLERVLTSASVMFTTA